MRGVASEMEGRTGIQEEARLAPLSRAVTLSVPGPDGGVPDLREVLPEQAPLREPVEAVLRLSILPGTFQDALLC